MRQAAPVFGIIVCVGFPALAAAKRDKPPPPPVAWQYRVQATREVSTTATGEGAKGMPEGLGSLHRDSLEFHASAAVTAQHPDASVTELLRIEAPDSPLDGRAIGLRRFDDGEVLKVERLAELSDTGILGWDPILGALSPARPEEVSAKKPGTRALQWTARIDTARFLRANCPSSWTLVDEPTTDVEGWLGRPVQHLRYEGGCGLNGRADIPGGGPVPLRGEGKVSGDVWWDVTTHQIVRHDLHLERTVRIRQPTTAGRAEIIQEQTYDVRVIWEPAIEPPRSVTALSLEAFVDVLPPLLPPWTACAESPGEQELVVVAEARGRLDIRAVRAPTGPASAAPLATATTGQSALPEAAPEGDSTASLECWRSALAGHTVPEHDDIGVEFTFVLPWRDGGFALPGVVDRVRPTAGPLFIVVAPTDLAATTAWLGVR